MSTDNSGPILPMYILVWSMLRREETGGGGVEWFGLSGHTEQCVDGE